MDSRNQPEETSNRRRDPENTQTITVHVHPTTGGQFEIEISPDETAEELRRKISRRLQTPKERLKVLFKEQVLEARPLKDYQIADGSSVTLLPSVESGFSSTVQGTQQSIIQAIESLSDPQIDDFLSGRLPLTLALRVGDHMMFVQLQLEQSQINSQSADPRPSRSRPSSQFSQISQSSPRLFADMSSASPLGATALYPKSPMGFNPKKSSSAPLCPVMAEPVTSGPAPKVPKLSSKSDAAQQSEFLKSDHEMSEVLRNSQRFHHHSAPSSPDEVPYAIFDPRFDSLHPYNQLASHINHHPQSGANHLHRLVTACSSLEQVVAIPPAGADPLKVPQVPEHSRKSSRKRPSTLLTPNTSISPPRSSQRNAYPDNMGSSLPTAAAIIQNALLRHQQLSGGFPPLPLLSSAYAKYQASSRASQGGSRSSPPSGSSSPTTPPAEIRQKHPITANMLQASSSGKSHSGSSSRSERHHHHHKRVSTSGRVTSGSLSHHSSGLSGARVASRMQRLRRLCGSHQQCVAYSNRELATEISSIVHMARHSHHSRSEGSTHRKSHKACRECHGRDRSSASGSTSGNPASTSGTQATGACIDTFTTHGPGIFSGTFSGSLHPSIQDADGKPKRDPKTILQILTDLLNATQQYQGQLGNVGLLPQIFKDHFKGDSIDSKAAALEKAKSTASTSDGTQKTDSKQCAEKIHPTKQGQPTPVYQQKYNMVPPAGPSSVGSKMPAPAQYLSSVSTIPIGNIPVAYATRHVSTRTSRRSSPNYESSKHHHRHHHGRCHHHYKQHSLEKVCCSSSSCRRQAKHQMLSALYVKRDHENTNTRNKMKELKKMMELKRHRRQSRRSANKICNKRSVVEQTKHAATATEEQPADNSEVVESQSTEGEVKSGKMEVQFDDIKEYEIKEVALEPPETVTV